MDAITPFTPVSSLVGGALIGLSAVWLMAANGRIAGISGITGGLVGPAAPGWLWRLAFVAGLIAAPLLVMLASGPVEISIQASPVILIAAGLLVGAGTQMGSGCTSGHGVCGMSLLSMRSFASVAVFMGVGALTVFITRHLIS